MEGVNQLRYILNTYVNVTMYPPAQLLCANKIIKKERDPFVWDMRTGDPPGLKGPVNSLAH
jgi:hypothetical protein